VSLFRDGPMALSPYTLASGQTLPPLRGTWVFYSPTARDAAVKRVDFDLTDVAPDQAFVAFRASRSALRLRCADDCELGDGTTVLGRFPLASVGEQAAIGVGADGALLLGAKADAEVYFRLSDVGTRLPVVGPGDP
jgi:hypothetical protein